MYKTLSREIFNREISDRDWRIHIAIIAIIILACSFWLSSRYPALNEKAMMGGDTPLSGLSFDIVYEILPNSGLWWELTANVVNWISTNIKGMTFGVLFGAAALTLLSLVKKRSFEGAFANSALGTVIGAPLGVCVNCAVPIAMGLHLGRMRLETTLSALLASPTLNVIVVTMSFALLPVHLAVIKLLLALVLVMLVIPLLCKYVLIHETDATRHDAAQFAGISEAKGFTAWIAKALTPVDVQPGPHAPLPALLWFIRAYARSFFFIFIITVPMMLLAALLGAIVATFASPTELLGLFPRGSVALVLLAMLATAFIASFVPAPIALDVILTTILINIGMRDDYATAALIGLGSFSIYAFIILWKVISLRTAMTLWAAVIAMAMVGGILANLVNPSVKKYYAQQQIAALNSVAKIDWPVPPEIEDGQNIAELTPLLKKQTPVITPLDALVTSDRGSAVTISHSDFALPSASGRSSVAAHFARIMGPEIGLDEIGLNSPIREFGYYMMRGAIAADDVHGDGWPDIVTRRPDHAKGLSLYANIGGSFTRQKLDLGVVDDSEVFNLALADMNGDGLPELFVSTIMNGDYIFYNQEGSFDASEMVQLSRPSPAVINSFAFADMDQDGDVDIIAGKWGPRGIAEGWRLRPLHIRNQIFWNRGNKQFEMQIMPGVPGQTLSSVISDFDGDGYLDYFNADDAGFSDGVTFFGENGRIKESAIETQPFPYHTRSSMSYDQGDWNGDLRTDYYGAQIAIGTAGNVNKNRPSRNRTIFEICAQFGQDLKWQEARIKACAQDLLSMDAVRSSKSGKGLDSCKRPILARDRALCGAASIFPDHENYSRKRSGDTERFKSCEKLLAHMPAIKIHCASLLTPADPPVSKEKMRELFRPGFANGNILMTATPDGSFEDAGGSANVRSPGWSWNSRFIDLDQDSRLDLLVMTGIWLNSASSTTNIFYRNNGRTFTDATAQYGFYDIAPSYSYVSLDYDRDGDIDIVRDNASLRMIVHRNDKPVGPALFVKLRGSDGNSQGIGARVTICVDGETAARPGKCQMRNIKASGGYMSSDPIQAHFGLGTAKSVSLIEVKWPDGELTKILPEQLLAGEITIRKN